MQPVATKRGAKAVVAALPVNAGIAAAQFVGFVVTHSSLRH